MKYMRIEYGMTPEEVQGVTHNQILLRQILTEEMDGKCSYCGCDVTRGKTPHIDHIEPISKGGSYDISNLRIACPHCNISKNNKDLEEWRLVAKKVTDFLFYFETRQMKPFSDDWNSVLGIAPF